MGGPSMSPQPHDPAFSGQGQDSSNGLARTGLPEISSLVVAAGQHMWLVLALTIVVGGGLAYLAWNMFPPTYTANSFVHVRQRSDFLLANQRSRSDDANFVRAQEGYVVAPQVLQRTLKDPEILEVTKGIPEASRSSWLSSITTANLKGGSEVMTVSVTHKDPEAAQLLANAITNSYVYEVTTSAVEERDRRRSELERLAKLADQRLGDRWKELETLAAGLGTGSAHTLSLRDQIEMQGYREYAQRLRSIQLERNQLDLRLTEARLRQESEFLFSEEELQYTVENHPEVVLQRQRIDELDARARELAGLVQGNESPRLIQIRDDRAFYVARLNESIEALRPKIRTEMQRRLIVEREEQTKELEQKLAVIEQEEAFLKGMLAQLEDDLDRDEGQNGVQLEIIRHEIDREESVADNLWRSLEQLKIEEQAQPRVAILEEANLPMVAMRSKQYRASVAAGGIGVFFVIFGIGYFEWRTCRIRHPNDMVSNTSLRLCGVSSFAVGLPLLWRLRNAKNDPITSGVSEVTAHVCQRAARGQSSRVYVGSSTVTEPRHLVAKALAFSLARAGQRVLLIDVDGQGSRLFKSFASKHQSAIKTTEFDDASPESMVLGTTQRDLFYASLTGAGGDDAMSPSYKLERLLEATAESFDAVVVHGPPILTSPESVLMASLTDTALLTVVVGKSRWNLLAAAQHRCASVGIHVFGAVMHVGQSSTKLGITDVEVGTATRRSKVKAATRVATEPLESEADIVRQIRELQQEVRNQDKQPIQEGSGETNHDSPAQ